MWFWPRAHRHARAELDLVTLTFLLPSLTIQVVSETAALGTTRGRNLCFFSKGKLNYLLGVLRPLMLECSRRETPGKLPFPSYTKRGDQRCFTWQWLWNTLRLNQAYLVKVSPVKTDGRTEGPVQVPAGDLELSAPNTPADGEWSWCWKAGSGWGDSWRDVCLCLPPHSKSRLLARTFSKCIWKTKTFETTHPGSHLAHSYSMVLDTERPQRCLLMGVIGLPVLIQISTP